MINRYKKELDQIRADGEFKEKLRQNLLKKETKLSVRKPRLILSAGLSAAVFILLVCGVFFSLSLRKPPNPSDPELPIIPISEKEFAIGGLGGIGTKEETDFQHTDPQAAAVLTDVLPVYKNQHITQPAEQQQPLPEDESRKKLEEYAERLGISNYTLSNSPIGMSLESSEWSIMLVYQTKTLFSYTGKDPLPEIGGKSKEEVLENVQRLLEEKKDWFGLDNPRIDVCADFYHPKDNNWQIRVIEDTKDAVQNLIAYQMNYIRIFTNTEGNFSMFEIYSSDASPAVGNYPIKTKEEALQDLREGKGFQPFIQGDPNQVLCTEMIYYTTNPASEYFLPYYKFYLSPGDAPVNYAEAYVPAVKNEYLTLTDERDEN